MTQHYFQEDQKYGNNRIIRMYSGWPDDKALPCRYEHGHCPCNQKPANDLGTKKQLMLVYNRRRLKLWQSYSKKKAVILGSPFVHYRRMMKISRAHDASGTLVFPFHSTPKEKGIFDREAYCRELKKLPPSFFPLKICIHEHDLLYGYEKIYEKAGFEVVSAGVREDPEFPARFYDLLRNCTYATSNAFGSYLFYAVEMDIPFFLYGPEVTVSYLTKGIDLKMKDFDFGGRIERLFSTFPRVEITPAQRVAVEEEIGMQEAIAPADLYQLFEDYYPRQRIIDMAHLVFHHPKNSFF